jgi:hypothetical protein
MPVKTRTHFRLLCSAHPVCSQTGLGFLRQLALIIALRERNSFFCSLHLMSPVFSDTVANKDTTHAANNTILLCD